MINREIEHICTKTTKYRKQCSKEFSHIQNYDYTVFCIASGALDISTRAIYVDIKYMWWNNLERFTIWSYSNNQNRKKSRRRRRRKQNKTKQIKKLKIKKQINETWSSFCPHAYFSYELHAWSIASFTFSLRWMSMGSSGTVLFLEDLLFLPLRPPTFPPILFNSSSCQYNHTFSLHIHVM